MSEWNATTYHRVSDPMLNLGIPVLARLPLSGRELVVDLGCGTGRLTELLLERLPHGKVIAADLSANMLRTAHDHLRPRFHDQVSFVRVDASALPFVDSADAVFSTATFHWVRDHDALFAGVHLALRNGGRLVAQCGGGPNIERLHGRCYRIMKAPIFAPFYADWKEVWRFESADATRARLERLGFRDIDTWLESTPIVHPDAGAFREFVANIVCRAHLARLPDDRLRNEFMDRLTAMAAADDPPFELDYWRLNILARK